MSGRPAAYAIALSAVAAAIAVRFAFDSYLGDRFPFITLFVTVVLTAALIRGRGPSIVAMLVGGCAAKFLFLDPRYTLALSPKYQVAMTLFIVASLTMIELLQGLRRARRRAESKQKELELEVQARIATEKALAEREGLLRTTFTSIGDGVVTTDARGNVISLNPVAESLTGWTTVEAAGRPLSSVFIILNEDTRQPVENPVDRVVQEGRVAGLADHTILVSRTGVECAIDDSAAPIRDDDGVLLGVVLVFRDVSKQREAARKLVEADRRKDEFLATLAHELRNPLAPISNSLETMKLTHLDPAATEQARATIERQVQQLVRLVDDLMDVNRITRNMLRLQKKRTAIATAIHEAVETCRPLCQAKHHTIRLRLPQEPLFVDADPVRLTQIFGNVLNNSCKYTDPGGEIELSVELRDGRAVVEVSDNGIGIAADMLPKVFDLFTQADGSIARAAGGLGIGLSLVRQLVEMHEGTVTIHSEGVGRGTRIAIQLPAAVDQTPDEPPPDAKDADRATGQRILVVDDNYDGAESLAILLRMTGNEVTIANDGPEALEHAAAQRPHLVFLDIGLPGMDGYEVCRRVREARWGRAITLMALTGWGQEEDRRKSREAGFDLHLVKPLEYDALLKVLADSKRRVEGE